MALPNTHFGAAGIKSILDGKTHLFFAGIGGVSMNSLAHISHLLGYKVTGYDRSPSAITKKLEDIGIVVYYESDESHMKGVDALIYTVAMPENNPEYAYAKKNGIPVISRADYLGYLMSNYTNRIGISGTHGKSTTTGMIARIMSCAKSNPTVLCGAPLIDTGTVDIIGGHEYFAFEACEYMDSFLDFYPTIAVVLNIELDHIDYFPSIDAIRESFIKFMNITGEEGYSVINLDDENCRLAAEKYAGNCITFARNNQKAMYVSANIVFSDGYPEFDVISYDGKSTHVKLSVPGEHNISNALASFAVGRLCGIPHGIIAEGLESYKGVSRRMEKICRTTRGAEVYSDYAHHPTEIASTLAGAKKICRGKLHVIFQPHTFSRTHELFDDFVKAFAASSADDITLIDIYPAREKNNYGVSSSMLSEKISMLGKKSHTAASFADAAEYATVSASDGDMIIVMGAGDVNRVAEIIKEKYSK